MRVQSEFGALGEHHRICFRCLYALSSMAENSYIYSLVQNLLGIGMRPEALFPDKCSTRVLLVDVTILQAVVYPIPDCIGSLAKSSGRTGTEST